MSTVAEFTIDAGDFPLGSLFEELPAVTVELERVVPTGAGVVPYLWISGTKRDVIESAFETDPDISSMQVVDNIDDQHLVRAQWQTNPDGLLDCIAQTGVTLLSATGTATEWTLQVRAQNREDIAAFRERSKEQGISTSVIAIQTLDANQVSETFGLTTAQREALRIAYNRGYFDESRQATLEEIASSMDISRQALAALLRRGHRNLIETTIVRR